MRNLILLLSLLCLALTACSRDRKRMRVAADANKQPSLFDGVELKGGGVERRTVEVSLPIPAGPPRTSLTSSFLDTPSGGNDFERQEKYEQMLASALKSLAARNYEKASAALAEARLMRRRDDDPIAGQALSMAQKRLADDTSAARVTRDIQVILRNGAAAEAVALAQEAIAQFEGSPWVLQLTRLLREAYALHAIQITDKGAFVARCRRDVDNAFKANNFRAAVVALEQAIGAEAAPELATKAAELRGTLSKFDALCARARELRQDLQRVEEALECAEQAARLWNTASVRQEMEEMRLMLHGRRDRVGVVPFEAIDDIGVANSPTVIADAIKPALENRYDVIDSAQLANVIDELRLRHGVGHDEWAQRKVADRARLRYLVLGTLTASARIAVRARLLDVATGLIVQTAEVNARDADELKKQLPQLGQVLLMSDEQKAAYDQRSKKSEVAVAVIKADDARIPPPPDLPLAEIPPPSLVVPANVLPARPPETLQRTDFDQLLPLLPSERSAPAFGPRSEQESRLRRRALLSALELGDNLWQRRQYRAANRQFEFAVEMFPDERELRARVDMCRPFVPPASADPPASAGVRPRLAVLDFATFGNEVTTSQTLGHWAAAHLGEHLHSRFQQADRAEALWWMGRLGITLRDLLLDPHARAYLGRALNVRYLLLGCVNCRGTWELTTYLVDAELGTVAGSGRVKARDRQDVQLQLGELAWLTMLTPAERRQAENDAAAWEVLVNQIRTYDMRDRLGAGMAACRKALSMRPHSGEVRLILRRAEREKQIGELQARHTLGLQGQSTEDKIAYQKRLDLIRNAELVRWQAQAAGKARSVDEQEQLRTQKELAANTLTGQADAALKANLHDQALEAHAVAAALAPGESSFRGVVAARVGTQATGSSAPREPSAFVPRGQPSTGSREQHEKESQQHDLTGNSFARFLQDRDGQVSDMLLLEAKKLTAAGQWEQAIAATLVAKRVRPTVEAAHLLHQILEERVRSATKGRGPAARAELERELTRDRQSRELSLKHVEETRKRYADLLTQGEVAFTRSEFHVAAKCFRAAQEIYPTDLVLTRVHQAEQALADVAARAETQRLEPERRRLQHEQARTQLAEARDALKSGQNDRAVELFRGAAALAPDDLVMSALVGLMQAEHARDQEREAMQHVQDELAKQTLLNRLLAGGKANLESRRQVPAVVALQLVLQISPEHADALALLVEARKPLETGGGLNTELKAKAARFEAFLHEGRYQLAAKDYDSAAITFQQALNEFAGDAVAVEFLREATVLQAELQRDQMAENRRRQEAGQRASQLAKPLKKVRDVLAAGELAEAENLLSVLDAQHDDVKAVVAEVRQARAAAEATLKAAQQRETRFSECVAQGRAALAEKKFDVAIPVLIEAVKLKPDEQTTRLLLRQSIKQRDATAPTPGTSGPASQAAPPAKPKP